MMPGLVAAAATGQPVAYALTPNSTLTVIDTGNQQILRTITLPALTSYLVAAPDGKHLYVIGNGTVGAGPTGVAVWVIDTQTFLITDTISLEDGPVGMVISSDGSSIYVATDNIVTGPELVAIDTATRTVVANLAIGNDSESIPVGIVLSPDDKRVYVPMTGQKIPLGDLAVFDTASRTILASPLPMDTQKQWYWAAVSPDSSKLFGNVMYEDEAGDQLTENLIFDATNNAQIGTAAVGLAHLSTPLPASSILYGMQAGNLVVYNVQTNAITATVPVATAINSLALTPDGKQLYVSNSNAQSIAILDTATNSITGNVSIAGATSLTIATAPPPFVAKPPVVNLSVSPSPTVIGSPAGPTWTTTGTDSCTSSGAWSGAVGLAGSSSFSFPTPGVQTFTLTCTGPGGTTSVSAKLTVIAGSTLSLNSTDAPVGSSILVSWQAFAGATDCTVTFGSRVLSAHSVSGSAPTGTLTAPGSGPVLLSCSGPAGVQTVSKSISAYAPGASGYASLVLPDNVYGIGTPGAPPPNGGLGGSGYAFDGPDLQGLPPSLLVAFGQTIVLGTAGKPSAVSRQTIALGSAQLTALTFVATAIKGNQLNQQFVVTYSDGSTTTYTQSLSDWGGPGGAFAGENGFDPASNTSTELALGARRISATGAVSAQYWGLNKYRLALDATKVATSLRLPNNQNVIVFAVNVTHAPKATAESLAAVYDVTAVATAGQPSNGAVRLASGYAYDASLLINGFTGVGQKFTLGAANQPDAVSNATITLAAKNRLGLTVLATGLNGKQASQAFKVTYQDGSTTTFNQSVSDWNQPQNFAGESLARNTGFRITPTGARQAGVWDVYAYTFQTDPRRQVVSLTLPNNRNVVVLAVNSLTQ